MQSLLVACDLCVFSSILCPILALRVVLDHQLVICRVLFSFLQCKVLLRRVCELSCKSLRLCRLAVRIVSHSESLWQADLCQGLSHSELVRCANDLRGCYLFWTFAQRVWALCEWLERVALCPVVHMANQGVVRLVGRPGTAMRKVEVWYLYELIRIARQVAMRGTPGFALRIGCAERKSYFYRDYWEDIGTIESFYDANLALTEEAAVLAMDDSVLDVDQVENLIKFCSTKEEIELLKGYTGDKENLGEV
ncbi:hypothetical protein LR48_Vigan03g048500 [Vigna angularis]|uniref:Uncharacterized protein n=1 Tax=Phaseolus angularis TaxID=3914 RepID=A0A0L9U3W9_PHAAN|nr:hypothetical protein LR48_Vigan03g048500 [Vigna angularis]